MPNPADKTTILDQISVELNKIQVKLSDSAGSGDVATLIATLVTNLATSKTVADTLAAQVVTSDAVIDTLTTNVATSKTAVDLLYDVGDAGTGIGPLADQQATTDLSALIVLAIAGET